MNIYNILALIIAVTVHEFSHAWVVTKLGDPTARVLGRVSLNPLRHIDPLGTLALIFLGFGWGKPVPFNPNNLAKPTRDSALIALAGPLSNILMAIIAAIPVKYLSTGTFSETPIYTFIGYFFIVNILLFSLNILPLPPFDGSKIIGIFVPYRLRHQYDKFLENGVSMVLIFIIFDQMVLKSLLHFSILGTIIGTISNAILTLVGVGS